MRLISTTSDSRAGRDGHSQRLGPTSHGTPKSLQSFGLGICRARPDCSAIGAPQSSGVGENCAAAEIPHCDTVSRCREGAGLLQEEHFLFIARHGWLRPKLPAGLAHIVIIGQVDSSLVRSALARRRRRLASIERCLALSERERTKRRDNFRHRHDNCTEPDAWAGGLTCPPPHARRPQCRAVQLPTSPRVNRRFFRLQKGTESEVWPGPPRLFFVTVIRHLHHCSSSGLMSSKTYYARGSAEDFLRLSLHSSAAASCVFSELSLVRGWRRDQGFDDKWTVKPEKKVEGWTEVQHCTYTCACYGLGDVFGTPYSILSFDSRH